MITSLEQKKSINYCSSNENRRIEKMSPSLGHGYKTDVKLKQYLTTRKFSFFVVLVICLGHFFVDFDKNLLKII